MGEVITVRELSKHYGAVRAVDDVSFEVAAGEFFGILGPNGAGKTTTLEIIEGLRGPDAGEVRLLDRSPWPRNDALLPRIGVQLQASAFFERLTVREQIQTFAFLYGVGAATADEWLDRVGLAAKADTRTEQLSGGQLQRVLIARALATHPELLLLDEPTASVDRAATAKLYELLVVLARRLTILLVSHDTGVVSRFVSGVLCVNRTVAKHPVSRLTGEMLSELYGTDIALVRHEQEL